MKSLSIILCGSLILSLLTGCSSSKEPYSFNEGGGGTETIGVEWKGAQTATPTNPDTNCAYLSQNDNVAYIWSGDSWDTLVVNNTNSPVAMEDLNKVSLRWKGILSEAPADPEKHWAYYDRDLDASFIWNDTTWSILTKDADTLQTVIWKGVLASAPAAPEEYWTYYNTTDKMSYRFTGGSWHLFDKDDLESFIDEDSEYPVCWKGALSSAPPMPELNWMYHNTNESTTFIYTGYTWDIFAENTKANDCAFLDGSSIIWNGVIDGTPPFPRNNTAYYNAEAKHTCLWKDTTYVFLYIDNEDEYTRWKGPLDSAPENPENNWAYYNTTTKESYLFYGSWVRYGKGSVVAIEEGGPIVWVGEYAEGPVSAQISWIYYNTTNKNTEIYNGYQWCPFTLDSPSVDLAGLKDVQVRWLGTLTTTPADPLINDGFLESTNRGCFLWNGDEWAILHMPNLGPILTWLGSYQEAPNNAPANSGYFNSTDKKSYRYDGNSWSPITRRDVFSL